MTDHRTVTVASIQMLNGRQYSNTEHFLRYTLDWRHDGRDGVSNHQPHDCLLNRLFKRRPKKTSQLCVTGVCGRTKGKWHENIAIWWRHHAKPLTNVLLDEYSGDISNLSFMKIYSKTSSVKCRPFCPGSYQLITKQIWWNRYLSCGDINRSTLPRRGMCLVAYYHERIYFRSRSE